MAMVSVMAMITETVIHFWSDFSPGSAKYQSTQVLQVAYCVPAKIT